MSIAPFDPALDAALERLAARMRKRLRVGGDTVPKTLRAGRGYLGARQQAEIDHILEALTMMAHPKVARQVDSARIARAVEDIIAHLQTVNPGRDRERRAFDIGVTIFLNLALLIGGIVAFLLWRGVI